MTRNRQNKRRERETKNRQICMAGYDFAITNLGDAWEKKKKRKKKERKRKKETVIYLHPHTPTPQDNPSIERETPLKHP